MYRLLKTIGGFEIIRDLWFLHVQEYVHAMTRRGERTSWTQDIRTLFSPRQAQGMYPGVDSLIVITMTGPWVWSDVGCFP